MERPRIRASALFQMKKSIREWLSTTSFIEFVEEMETKIIAQPELRRACLIIYKYLEAIAYDKQINCNFIIAGPSGCGKTTFYECLRDYFSKKEHPHIAISCVDMTTITSPGFKGAEPSDILRGYISDPASTSGFGICFLDEFDKRLIPMWGGTGGRSSNVSVEAQNGMLKLIEGADITLLSGETVNTSKLCFVAMGSFNHCRKQECGDSTYVIGFNRDNELQMAKKETREQELFKSIAKSDIIKGGGSIELIGRFNEVVNFKPMSADDLDKLIEKVRKDVADSFSFLDIELMPEMIEYLKTQANTEFGVRYLSELLRKAVVTGLIDFYTSKHCAEMQQDDMLVITLYDQDGYSYHIRKMTETEREYYNQYRPEDIDEKDKVEFETS